MITPVTIKIMAAQKVEVTGSRRKQCAQAMVLSGMRLLNNITRLVRQRRSASFQSA